MLSATRHYLMRIQQGARMEKLMSVADVADYLGVPVRTIYSWRARSIGPVGIRVGRHIKYRRESVEDFLEDNTEPRENRAE